MIGKSLRVAGGLAAFAVAGVLATPAQAIIVDDFSSYADQAAFDAAWPTGKFGANAGADQDWTPDFYNVAFDAANDKVTMSVDDNSFALVNVSNPSMPLPFGPGMTMTLNVDSYWQADGLGTIALALNGTGGKAWVTEIVPLDVDGDAVPGAPTYDGVNVDGFTVNKVNVKGTDGGNITLNNGGSGWVTQLAADISTGAFALSVDQTNVDVLFDGTSLLGGPVAHGLGADSTTDVSELYHMKFEVYRYGNPANNPQLAPKSLTVSQATLVPEPASLALLGLGGLAMLRRR